MQLITVFCYDKFMQNLQHGFCTKLVPTFLCWQIFIFYTKNFDKKSCLFKNVFGEKFSIIQLFESNITLKNNHFKWDGKVNKIKFFHKIWKKFLFFYCQQQFDFIEISLEYDDLLWHTITDLPKQTVRSYRHYRIYFKAL